MVHDVAYNFPVLVSLVQFASTVPLFLFALPAGSLGDIVDRRKILIYSQIWMLVSAAVLSAIAFAGRGDPFNLLLLTFILGVGDAVYTPVSQAIMPEIVDRNEIKSAATLSSAEVNVARAIGPIVAGVAIALAGPAFTFLGLMSESFSEALVLAQKESFDVKTFVDVINKTAHRNAFSESKGPKIAAGNFEPAFSLNNLLKDLRLAERQANVTSAILPMSKIALDQHAKAAENGLGEKDIIAIALNYKERTS